MLQDEVLDWAPASPPRSKGQRVELVLSAALKSRGAEPSASDLAQRSSSRAARPPRADRARRSNAPVAPPHSSPSRRSACARALVVFRRAASLRLHSPRASADPPRRVRESRHPAPHHRDHRRTRIEARAKACQPLLIIRDSSIRSQPSSHIVEIKQAHTSTLRFILYARRDSFTSTRLGRGSKRQTTTITKSSE